MIKDSYTQLHFPEVSSIQIHTDRLLYAGYSQEVSLPYEAVKTDNFTLETDWTQDDRKVTTITSGKYVKLHTRVKVHKDATYVSLEIPIPAGCTYAEKPQPVSNYYSSSGEVYREYFKDRVVVYYEKLPAGWYDLYFKLEPRFRGNYTVNNSLMESMYFPQLNGYNALQKVRIK